MLVNVLININNPSFDEKYHIHILVAPFWVHFIAKNTNGPSADQIRFRTVVDAAFYLCQIPGENSFRV